MCKNIWIGCAHDTPIPCDPEFMESQAGGCASIQRMSICEYCRMDRE